MLCKGLLRKKSFPFEEKSLCLYRPIYLTQHVNPLTKNFFKVVLDSSQEAEVFQKMHQDKSILAGMDA